MSIALGTKPPPLSVSLEAPSPTLWGQGNPVQEYCQCGGLGGGRARTDILENQLLPDPIWPWKPPSFPRALWVEGKMRVSQVSRRGPYGITFKTLSLAVHSWLPAAPLTCLGIRLRGVHKASISLLHSYPFVSETWFLYQWYFGFLFLLMLFPAAVHSYPSPAST